MSIDRLGTKAEFFSHGVGIEAATDHLEDFELAITEHAGGFTTGATATGATAGDDAAEQSGAEEEGAADDLGIPWSTRAGCSPFMT